MIVTISVRKESGGDAEECLNISEVVQKSPHELDAFKVALRLAEVQVTTLAIEKGWVPYELP